LSKVTIRVIPALFLLSLAYAAPSSAQQVSAYFGMGSATDGPVTSPGCPSQQVDDPFGGLTPPASCVPAQSMGGVFGVFGAEFMITPHVGVNGEYSFRFAQAAYLPNEGFNVRPAFYDFNALYQPITGEGRVIPVLEGGIGGTKLSFYGTQQVGSLATQSQYLFSTNHFQLHGAVGVKLYFSSSAFIKPPVDFHWTPNLNGQYASNFTPQYTVAIGYTFGR